MGSWLSLCHGIFTDWSIFITPFLLWKKGSSGPVTQWRQLVPRDCSRHSHWSSFQRNSIYKYIVLCKRMIAWPYSSWSLLFTNLVTSLNEQLDTSIRVLYSVAWGLGGGLLTNCWNWPVGYQLVRKWNASVLPNRELFPAKLTLCWKDDKAG